MQIHLSLYIVSYGGCDGPSSTARVYSMRPADHGSWKSIDTVSIGQMKYIDEDHMD